MNGAELARWADNTLVRLQNVPEQLARLPAHILLAIIAYCAFIALVACVGWSRSSAERRRRARAAISIEHDRAELQKMYDAEVKWRAATKQQDNADPLKRQQS